MTRRFHRRIFAPKRLRPWAVDSDYGRHPLDSLRPEIMPHVHRDAGPDDPWLAVEKSETIQALWLQVESAQAYAGGARISADQGGLDLEAFCLDAKCTPKQTEALSLAGDGWSIGEIAAACGVTRAAIWTRLYAGRRKLLRQVPPIVPCDMVESQAVKHAPEHLEEDFEIARRYIQTRIVVDQISGCWVWQHAKTRSGYGFVSYTREPINQARTSSHRVAYTVFVGTISDGLVLDHLCRNRACCNPEHLEPITR